MLRLTAEVRPGVEIHVEAENQKALFREYAGAWEIFSERQCGLCGGPIRPKFREVTVGRQVYDYYEYECLDGKCRAKLGLGAHLTGETLFPQRKLMPSGEPEVKKHREAGLHGEYGPHNGWTRYRGESTDDGAPEAPPPHQGNAPVAQAARSLVNTPPTLNDKPGTITRDQKSRIEQYAMQFGWSYADLCKQLQTKLGDDTSDTSKLSERQAAAVIGGLKSKAEREITTSGGRSTMGGR